MTEFGSSVLVHHGTAALAIESRTIAPDEPGHPSGNAYQGALAYAAYTLGHADLWGQYGPTPDRAMTYSAVYGCVRVIAEAIASVGWHVYTRGDDERVKIPLEDDVSWMLEMQASPEMSAFDWRQVMLKDAILGGNGYSEIERLNNGKPTALWRIDPSRVKLIRDDEDTLWYRVDNGPGTPSTFLRPADVYHLKGLGPDGLVGWAFTTLARRAIALGLAEEKFGIDFFSRGPMPGGFVSVPGNLNKEQRAEFRRNFEQVYSGSENAHRIVVLSNGVTFDPASLPNDSAQFLDSRVFQVNEVCRFLGVPPHLLADLSRATFCVPFSALISTDRGPRPAGEIVAGDRVWSLDDGGQLVLSSVQKAACTGEDEILTIRTRNRTLRCNTRHRVLVRRECLVPYVGGQGWYVEHEGGKFRRSHRTEWVAAGELQVGDHLVSACDLPDQGGRHSPTREVSVEFMEVLGLLTGDGFFMRQKKSRVGLGFGISHGEDDAYLPHYVGAVVQEFRRCDGPYGRRNGGTAAIVPKERDKNTTVFNSGIAYDELEACGIVGTAKTKHVPEWIFGLSLDLRLAFLRGYLDADGTVKKGGQIQYASVNRRLIEQARHLCISCGIKVANVYASEIRSKFEGYPEHVHVLYSFICTDVVENLRIGSHTPLYVERMTARLHTRRRTLAGDLWPCQRLAQGVGETTCPTPIVSITRSDKSEPVFDISVSETHTFVCDGVIVHNSNIEEMGINFVRTCLLGWARRLESEADLKLYGRTNRGRRFTRLNLDALQRGNSQMQTTTVTQKVAGGIMTPNEGREYLDLNPVGEEGDVLLVQGAMMPLERAVNPPEPPSPAPPPPANDKAQTNGKAPEPATKEG